MNGGTEPLDIDRAYAEQTARIVRARMPYGALTFLLVLACAAIPELAAHPARAGPYAVFYGLEALLWAVAIVWTRRATVPVDRAVPIALVTATGLIALVTAYHVVAAGAAEVLVLALGYITVGAMVLFPWGGRSQAAVAGASLAAYLIAAGSGVFPVTPFGMHVLGLGSVAALTVGSAVFLERYRLAFFRQAAELRRANEALQAASRAKMQFLSNVSHELRTPLNVMIGYTQLLQEGAFGDLSNAAQEPVARLLANSGILLRLVDDLLDLSRLETNRLTLRMERIDVAPLCTEAADLVAPLLHGKPVELACHVAAGETVYADRDRLRQVLVNLLTNAAKFTARGRVDLHARRLDEGTVVVEVGDTGLGIPPEEQPLIFEPFWRGTNANAIGGVGIGLALSRQLTEAMGGTLTVMSDPGRGSTFSVRLRRPAENEA